MNDYECQAFHMKLLELHIPKLLIGLILLLLSGLLLKVEINISRQPHDVLLHKLGKKEIWLTNTLINYVNQFELRNSRIPTPEEIDMWVAKYDKSNTYKVVSYQYLTNDYPAELTQVFGSGPQNGYVFRFKAPNRYVYYHSWNKDEEYGYILSSDYYLFGSKERALLLGL